MQEDPEDKGTGQPQGEAAQPPLASLRVQPAHDPQGTPTPSNSNERYDPRRWAEPMSDLYCTPCCRGLTCLHGLTVVQPVPSTGRCMLSASRMRAAPPHSTRASALSCRA
jgi:hypothetical protein